MVAIRTLARTSPYEACFPREYGSAPGLPRNAEGPVLKDRAFVLVDVVAAYSNLLHPHKSQRELRRLLQTARSGAREPEAPAAAEPVRLRRRLGTAAIAQIVADYRDGASVSKLAAAHGTSSAGMLRLLKEEGVKMRFQHLTEEQVAEVVRLYESGLSTYKIQDELGIPKTTVRTALQRAGVQMRPRPGAGR